MKIRFIYYSDQIMIVIGYTYDTRFDPPECYVVVPLKDAITKSLFSLNEFIVPISEADEVTDPKTINTILLLYS